MPARFRATLYSGGVVAKTVDVIGFTTATFGVELLTRAGESLILGGCYVIEPLAQLEIPESPYELKGHSTETPRTS